MRERYADEIERAGQGRRAALDQADTQLRVMKDLLPGAIDAGLPITEIARLSGVSRPTLYDLLKDSEAEPDLPAAVLAALVEAPRTSREIGEALGIDNGRASDLMAGLQESGWLEAVDGGKALPERAYIATKVGETALRDWEFPEEVEDRTTKTLRVAVNVLRLTPEDRAVVNRKIAHARAQGKEQLGLLEAVKMGATAELKAWLRRDSAEDGS